MNLSLTVLIESQQRHKTSEMKIFSFFSSFSLTRKNWKMREKKWKIKHKSWIKMETKNKCSKILFYVNFRNSLKFFSSFFFFQIHFIANKTWQQQPKQINHCKYCANTCVTAIRTFIMVFNFKINTKQTGTRRQNKQKLIFISAIFYW